jgi:hypothetical protein
VSASVSKAASAEREAKREVYMTNSQVQKKGGVRMEDVGEGKWIDSTEVFCMPLDAAEQSTSTISVSAAPSTRALACQAAVRWREETWSKAILFHFRPGHH